MNDLLQRYLAAVERRLPSGDSAAASSTAGESVSLSTWLPSTRAR